MASSEEAELFTWLKRQQRRLRIRALRYALAYLALGLFWIFGTDRLLSAFGEQWFVIISQYKGSAFVIVTAGLFFLALRSRDEAEYAALNRHYEYILKYANDILILLDDQDHVVDANDKADAAYGYPRNELIGMSMRQFSAESVHARIESDLTRTGEGVALYETTHRRKDGTTFPVEVSARHIDIKGHRFRQMVIRDITEQYKDRQALMESEIRYRNLVELTPDAIAVVATDGRIVSANPAGLRMFGLESLDQVAGQSMYQFVPHDQMAAFAKYLAELMRLGSNQGVEIELQRRGGSRFSVEISATLVNIGPDRPPLLMAIIRDITERKLHEERLLALNRALLVLSECNGALVRATAENELLEQICKTLTITGGYRMAWVGYREDDALAPMNISWSPNGPPEGASPEVLTRSRHPQALAWKVIDQGTTMYIQDVGREPPGEWRDRMIEKGLGAILTLPLKDAEQIFGLLGIGAARTNAFGEDEVKLLEQLGADLAFGIRMLRIGKARDKALQSLNASESKLKTIIENASDGIAMLDPAGVILYANPSAERLLARPLVTLVGSQLEIPLDGKKPIELIIQDGSPATIELTVAATDWDGKPAHIVVLHDISVRMQIELERQQHMRKLQDTLIQTIEAMALTVEKRDPYTAGPQARVAELAVAIGHEMLLPQSLLDGIRLGAMIHDIGKIYIPAEILNRPGRLGEHEMGLIRTHPQVGFDIVKNVDFLWPVKEMILQHHERLDGSGYPAGLKGGQIVLEARILAVADVVEAITAHRPYRPALGIDKGLAEIREKSGAWYDPAAVAACLRLFDEKHFSFDAGSKTKMQTLFPGTDA